MDRFSELKAFVLVGSTGGFSTAARQLGVATSSVTRLVDALEERIGVPLLNRSTRSVTLTDTGHSYFGKAQLILEQLEAADDAASARGSVPQGVLRVTVPVSFCTLYIAPMLAEFGRRYPKVELEVQLSDAFTNMVDESIDVAIRIGAIDQQPSLIARRLAGHQRILCASPAYLAAHGTPATPTALLRHNCLQLAFGGPRRSWRLQRGDDVQDIAVRGTLSVNNGEVIRQAAADGAGIALLADWLVGSDLRSGRLVRLLSDYLASPGTADITADVAVHAVYQANRRGSLKVKAFVDMLAAHLDDVLGQPL
ncbi:LysR family transcriptional regulator [Pseudoduganella ginsengisoli]|uniref:LysR family transcriptional regulator n=1 Tax=Pseudoduganella ginsengisoli TaxID=1462440 RepID=A0A6L6Q7K0_9BURK|nr:LysR family transcriptional regulator [Pseudoduganella ginsengisoli]MTW05198.1 LysR family transcriptional regulator [Pseudoduganella ginsengisoli]